mgnify:CR=1 FL=1
MVHTFIHIDIHNKQSRAGTTRVGCNTHSEAFMGSVLVSAFSLWYQHSRQRSAPCSLGKRSPSRAVRAVADQTPPVIRIDRRMTTCMLGTPLIDIAMSLKRETILILVSRLWYLSPKRGGADHRRAPNRISIRTITNAIASVRSRHTKVRESAAITVWGVRV